PWYELPGIDFVSENLWPHKLRDVQRFHYQLQPLQQVRPDDVRRQAEGRRARGQGIAPRPPAPPAPPPAAPATLAPPAPLSRPCGVAWPGCRSPPGTPGARSRAGPRRTRRPPPGPGRAG